MSNNIIIFTLEGCSHCIELKKRLKEESIPFTEVEVSKNKEIWDKVVEQTGHNALPTTYISLNGGEEGPVFVPDRDYHEKEEIVEIVKKYI